MRVSWTKKIYHVCVQIRMTLRDCFNVFIGTPAAFWHWRMAHPVYLRHWRTDIRFVLSTIPRCFKSLNSEIGKMLCVHRRLSNLSKNQRECPTLGSVRNKSESLTHHIIVPITVTFVTSTECCVKTYKIFNIVFLSR